MTKTQQLKNIALELKAKYPNKKIHDFEVYFYMRDLGFITINIEEDIKQILKQLEQ